MKGEEKGNDVKELCERFRLVTLGRAHRLAGNDVNSLCERSRNTSAVKSANEPGSVVSLLI